MAAKLTAYPEIGGEAAVSGDCAACHGIPASEQTAPGEKSGLRDGSWVNGRFSIDPEQTALDLGIQLDGKELGALERYIVQPGETVRPAITATNLDGSTSFTIRGMHLGGVNVSQNNFLTYTYDTEGSGDPPWVPQDVFVQPSWQFYYTWAGYGMSNPGPSQIDFPMQIDASTPEDIYLLTLGLAIFEGSDLHYEEHSFYLQVGSGGLSVPQWGRYDIVDDIFVDTGDWIGWLSLFDPSGGATWAYSFDLDAYLFFQMPPLESDNGVWLYLQTPSN